ncbi:MAG: hypothetical protein ACJ746_09260 [Bryobacteraceae bacterium]
MLGDCVRIPCFERAAHSSGDRRNTCRIGFAGQGLSGLGEFRANSNPSQQGLPWKPYTVEGKETMIFDTVSEVRRVDDDKLLSLLPPPAFRF